MDDHELLRAYVQGRSQAAFREIVDRHLGMVYSAAWRMVHDAHLAEEVAQSVFATLAQKVASVTPSQSVGGWLYNTTRHLALHAVRREQRRRQREQTAATMQTQDTHSDTQRIAEFLEPAMEELEASERDVLVLRYLEDRSLRAVGQELGISEDAARMRVNRALEQLRTVLGRKGVATTTAILATAITANTSTAVPAGLAVTITNTALAGTAGATAALTQGAITGMNLFNAKSVAAMVGVAILAGTGTYVVQHREINRLRSANQDLLVQQERAKSALQAAASKAQADREELERLRSDQHDVLRLRNEVGQLRGQLEVEKQRAARQHESASKVEHSPDVGQGEYIPKDQLANLGYATPETALETITWAMMNGTYDQVIQGLSPELLANELKDTNAPAQFAAHQQVAAPLFKGFQVVAKKFLTNNMVELKCKMDADPLPGQTVQTPEFLIQPMVNVNNEWKLGGSTHDYQPSWDLGGQVQILGQQ